MNIQSDHAHAYRNTRNGVDAYLGDEPPCANMRVEQTSEHLAHELGDEPPCANMRVEQTSEHLAHECTGSHIR